MGDQDLKVENGGSKSTETRRYPPGPEGRLKGDDLDALSKRQTIMIIVCCLGWLASMAFLRIQAAIQLFLLMVIGLVVTYWGRKRLIHKIIAAFICGVILIGYALPFTGLVGIEKGGKEVVVKHNLKDIQLAIERYAADHGSTYPASLDPLLDEHYIDKFPRNPYAEMLLGPKQYVMSAQQKEQAFRMKNIHPAADDKFSGNFSYLPTVALGTAGQENISGYVLLAYEKDRLDKSRWPKTLVASDCVCLVLTNADATAEK